LLTPERTGRRKRPASPSSLSTRSTVSTPSSERNPDALDDGDFVQSPFFAPRLARRPPKRAIAETEACAICLGGISEAGKLGCVHRFCFECIKRWSFVMNACPLCKRNFQSIAHFSRDSRFQKCFKVVQTSSPSLHQDAFNEEDDDLGGFLVPDDEVHFEPA